jgi:hypothetical protein
LLKVNRTCHLAAVMAHIDPTARRPVFLTAAKSARLEYCL